MSLRRRNHRKKRHDLRRVLFACAGGLVGAGTLVAAHSFELVRDEVRADTCDAVKLGQNSRIFDRNGKLLTTIAAENNRDPIRYDDMPTFLIDATVAIEDKKFFEHRGIDYRRIASAAYKDVSRQAGSNDGRQGGSTITMQLMKNLCHPSEARSVSIKLTEAYLASNFEKRYSKKTIMQRYLNSVFYGNNSIGVQAASQTYFSRDAAKLTLPQAALLAGLPQAPSDYNPFRRYDDALERRNLVLDEMVEEGFITAQKAAQAKRAGLGLKKGNAFGLKREGYYTDYVQNILDSELGRKRVQEGGYRISTTIDPKLQDAARTAMRNVLSRYSSAPPSAAVVMIDAKSGHVLTMASSEEYNRKNLFNVAGPDALRRAGSTFKTFVLTTALERGISPNTRYFSKSPLKVAGPGCPGQDPSYAVSTYSRSGGGMMSIAQATVRSDNSVYAQMTCDVGPDAVYTLMRKLGITSLVPDDQYNVSLGLGSPKLGVSVLEMARAYAPLANGGFKVRVLPMTKLVRPDGKVTSFKPNLTRVLSAGVAAEVTKILRANVQGGTGTTANLPNVPVAGKTGTVDEFKDAWFVGYTPKYVTAVWVGYSNPPRSMPGVTGGSLPASIWRQFMEVATKGESDQAFLIPKTPFVSKPFSSYWTRQASALAAAATKKKADGEAKKKKEDEDKKKDRDGDGVPDEPGTPADPTTPGTPTDPPPTGGAPPAGDPPPGTTPPPATTPPAPTP